ncbi:MBL fold metallo-hydrolase [Haloferax gibbonsii]|uniref:Metal-dependent hydrolase domain protein n=1 Tax=Haloferax gibbonsii TaxID=35746 RepID=A0A0K1IXT9_HALGI|nr:MBL fold metallo-hydrolase [Haloferax gibbonsii]AKU09337.1 Zn-dependent hydrolase [Haloferax gibbonsii]QOS13378.1 metal-dependent hydrolase domain protein [Haloferax gibbonsii]
MTITSDWGEWWAREELNGVDVEEGVSLWYLGVAGWAIRTPETAIYIDPYFSTERDREYVARMSPVPMEPQWADACDAVFCTHDHRDHFWPPSFGPLLDHGGDVHAPVECYENFDVSAIDEDKRTAVEPGDSYEVGDLTVHVRGGYDPDATGTVTYVIEHETGTIFHGGDNRPCEAFHEIGAEFDIDLGMLSYGTDARVVQDGEVITRKLYNDADEIVEATNALGIDRLIPEHWRRWRSIHADPGALSKAATTFEYPHVIEEVEVGDRFRLGRPGVVPPARLGGE